MTHWPVTLWMAEGTSNRVYVLGSVHLLREQDHPLPRVIDAVYDDAETLYMELDMDDLDPLLLQATIDRLGLLDEDTSLRDVMGDELYAEAAAAAAELDIPLEMLERTEPWFAAITVEQLALEDERIRMSHDPQRFFSLSVGDRSDRGATPAPSLRRGCGELLVRGDGLRPGLLQVFGPGQER